LKEEKLKEEKTVEGKKQKMQEKAAERSQQIQADGQLVRKQTKAQEQATGVRGSSINKLKEVSIELEPPP